MKKIRVGTRGSELALRQTNWVLQQLRELTPDVDIERIIIKTHGDIQTQQPIDEHWPVGGFVGAIEKALLNDEIDLAVHSYKDLQSATTPGLIVAAIPGREVAHDTLITRRPVELRHLPKGFRIGTGSPRRAAQFRRLGHVDIVPIRGNILTRLAKIDQAELDGVVLAAAGLKRLSVVCQHRIDLPTNEFVPAPAQGALALQTRAGGETMEVVRDLDDAPTRTIVTAERSFLRHIDAGCRTPVGALAHREEDEIVLLGQLFSENGLRVAVDTARGKHPDGVGRLLAERLVRLVG